MGRDGSDSDYLRENGYGFLVEGEIPLNWGKDSYNEYEPSKNTQTLGEAIREGIITDGIRNHLVKELGYLKLNYPNSWDRKFTEDMINYRYKLSGAQIDQLERILQDPITEEEGPGGIDLMF